ncbi:MAG: insulinase family protein [Bacteroidales bacterium]|nr:insulinase family protein [Bacteroidales bacterium]
MSNSRTKQPEIQSLDTENLVDNLIQPVKYKLDNGIPVYLLNSGKIALSRIEFIFPAGTWFQDASLVARSTNSLLKEGTSGNSSEEISRKLDYYGAHLDNNISKDNAYIELYSLNKHLKNTLPVVEDIIKNAVFPQHEFEIFANKQKHNYLINSQKVSYLARTHFTEYLFGAEHPYGQRLNPEDFDRISREQLIAFHKAHYSADQCKIIVAGLVDEDVIGLLNDHFGKEDWSYKALNGAREYQVIPSPELRHFIPKEEALQSALRIGKRMFNRKHPDYIGMQVVNTILGGFFGSRLMKNIREDKGYTYGIGSALIPLHRSGVFFITSEVGAEVAGKAVEEIYKELKKLRDEAVNDEELHLVKNYMSGTFLRSIDGPIAAADRLKDILEYDLDYHYYAKFLKRIKTITAEEIRELANRYLTENTLHELIVGKK